MNIDRHNYEEFFILYMDNELSSEQRREVELFVQANPDLQEELAMLQQSRYVADEAITFDDKTSLMRYEDCDITLNNYEEWLLLYIDDELTPKQKKIVEDFAALYPAVKQELDLFRQTKLQREEAIVFPGKESLYRKEETTHRVVAMRWWRMAAAAVLILAVAGVSFFAFDKNGESATGKEPLANTEKENNIPSNPSTEAPVKEQPVINNVKEETAIPSIVDKKADKKAIRKHQPSVKENEPVVAVTNEKNKNNLPEPTYNPNIKGNIDNNGRVTLSPVNTMRLTDINENDVILAVTPNTPSTLEHAVAIEEEPQPDRKNSKLRGFFRKVTRTLEKTTNIKATDEDGRLLIAGLAIKL